MWEVNLKMQLQNKKAFLYVRILIVKLPRMPLNLDLSFLADVAWWIKELLTLILPI